MTNPKISVIVPCYNMERYLPQCLDSILSQTLGNIEAVCIDDGSQDRTGAILDEARSSDPRVRVLHQENKGVASARNAGLDMARGQFVAFLDPDDFYPDSFTLALLYDKATKNHALICGGSFSDYQEPTGRIITCYTGDYSGYTFVKEGFLPYRDYQFDFGYHRFLYDRAFLEAHGLRFPPYARYQDPPFFVRAMILAEKCYCIPEPVYRYRVGIQDKPTSWPAAKLHDMIRGHLEVLRLSRVHGLPRLQRLTVRRREGAWEPVQASLDEGNAVTRQLVAEFQKTIDPDILPHHTLRAASRGLGSKCRSLLQFFRDFGFRRTLLLLRENLGK